MPEEAPRASAVVLCLIPDGTLADSLPAVERAWCSWADCFNLFLAHDEVLALFMANRRSPCCGILWRVNRRRKLLLSLRA